MSKYAQYSKFLTALVGQALTFATLYYGSNNWVAAAVAAASALGVYAVPNGSKPAASGQGEHEAPSRM